MVTILALASLLYWVALGVVTWKTIRGVPPVPAATPTDGQHLPSLSIVIPARNEADHIEGALRSKLAASYPALEVVFVDDRSTDATGRIADALAERDPRLCVVHVTELPPEWLGKVHAMQRGLERASGEWILFSDADVHFAPALLERVLAHAVRERAGHVSIIPHITTRGLLLLPALAAFFRVVTTGGRLWSVPNQRSSAAVGIGAFNLVHRDALARSPGLEWLKMEVADDMSLGMMLKGAGARSLVLQGRNCVELEFYPSYRALARSVEKNGASVPFPVLLTANALLFLLEGGAWLGPPALALPTAVLAFVVCARLTRWMGQPIWPTLIPAFGMLLLTGAIVRSGLLAWWRGGVVWRGTVYPREAIRAGARYGFRTPASSTPPPR